MKFWQRMAKQFLKLRKQLQKRYKAIIALAAVVVFVTTYALILPAVTEDTDTAASDPALHTETVAGQSADNGGSADGTSSGSATLSNPETTESKQEDAAAETTEETGAAAEETAAPSEDLITTDGTQLNAARADGQNFSVWAVVNADAKLNADTVLSASEIAKDADATKDTYAAYFEKATAAMNEVKNPIVDAHFYDISFTSASKAEDNGIEEPAADVKTTIQFDNPIALTTGQVIRIAHIDQNGNLALLDTDKVTFTNTPDNKIGAVTFTANQFSVYGVVVANPETDADENSKTENKEAKSETASTDSKDENKTDSTAKDENGAEKETKFTDGELPPYDGDGYKVTVSYDADAEIPEGATLDVKEITGDDAKTYADKASAKLNAEVKESRFFDIHILDKDGNKIQPKKAVTIKITYDKPFEVGKGEKIQQVHFKDSSSSAKAPRRLLKAAPAKGNNNDNIEVLDVKADGDESVNSIEFTQDSFSVTGTVVTSLADKWPDKTGYYAVIIKASDGKYYAVRSITTGDRYYENYNSAGSLTEVDYDDSTKKVTFKDITESDELKNYEWEYLITDATRRNPNHYLNNGENYIDPTQNDGIGTASTSSNAHALSRSRNGYLYCHDSRNNYYLTADVDNLQLGGTTSSSDQNIVQVYFANDFEAANTHGGSEDPTIPDVDLGAPATSKTLNSNNDGTYNLSLSVTGKSQAQQSRSKADVVIVFDRSASMLNTDAGNGQRRDTVAIGATKGLVSTLLQNNTPDYPDTVNIGFVTFNNNATTALDFTHDRTTIDNLLNGDALKGDNGRYVYDSFYGYYWTGTGTNWEAALQTTNRVLTSNLARSDAKKYVIFVSDGNPTYYSTDQGYNDYKSSVQAYGSGQEQATNIRRSYNAAVDDARVLVKNDNAEFYTIGVFGNPDRMSSLTAYAYSGNSIGRYPSGHYQTASDTTSLNRAFANIINEINKNFAFTDVTLTDGITELTSTTSVSGEAGKFIYSGNDKDGNPVVQADIPNWVKTAKYDSTSKSVIWNLGNNQLPNGVTYKVSFTVWPTQQAYDVVAALQNQTITWQQEGATVNGQAVDWDKFVRNGEEGNYSYSYKTNTSQTVTYKQITTDSDGKTTTSDEKEAAIPADPLPAMPLDHTQISVHKTFEGGKPNISGLILSLKQDGTDFINPLTLKAGKDNADTFTGTAYIAPGLIRTTASGYEILEKGHDYLFTEGGTDASKWTLNTVTYHPMVIGTKLKMLQKLDKAETGKGIYQIPENSNNYYKVIDNDDSIIYATNTIKTVNIKLKKVDSKDPDKALTGAEFTLTYGNPSNNATATNGITGGKITFGSNSEVDITGLPVNTYTLTETKAPDGYIVNNTGKTLEITADGVKYDGEKIQAQGGVYVITITNEAGQALPNTGGHGTLPYTVGGLLVVIAAGVIYVISKKRFSYRG